MLIPGFHEFVIGQGKKQTSDTPQFNQGTPVSEMGNDEKKAATSIQQIDKIITSESDAQQKVNVVDSPISSIYQNNNLVFNNQDAESKKERDQYLRIDCEFECQESIEKHLDPYPSEKSILPKMDPSSATQ